MIASGRSGHSGAHSGRGSVVGSDARGRGAVRGSRGRRGGRGRISVRGSRGRYGGRTNDVADDRTHVTETLSVEGRLPLRLENAVLSPRLVEPTCKSLRRQFQLL